MPTVHEKQLARFQLMFDYIFAWRLQAKEQKNYHDQKNNHSNFSSSSSPESVKSISYTFYSDDVAKTFKLRPVRGDGDCFFHAINQADFNRACLVEKLLQNPTDEVRAVFSSEICQFLYLGWTRSHLDEAENNACRKLLTNDIEKLFLRLNDAEQQFSIALFQARMRLGEAETKGKTPQELLNLLNQQQQQIPLINGLNQTYKDIKGINQSIYNYCFNETIFKDYVRLYLNEAKGYIPFSRDVGTELSINTIDIINQLFQVQIQVYLSHPVHKDQLVLVTQPCDGEPIPIFHDGVNHFSGLVIWDKKQEEQFIEPKLSANRSVSKKLWTDTFVTTKNITSHTKGEDDTFRIFKDIMSLLKGESSPLTINEDGTGTAEDSLTLRDFVTDLQRAPWIESDSKVLFSNSWFVSNDDYHNCLIKFSDLQSGNVLITKDVINIYCDYNKDNVDSSKFEVRYEKEKKLPVYFRVNKVDHQKLFEELFLWVGKTENLSDLSDMIHDEGCSNLSLLLLTAIDHHVNQDIEYARKGAIDKYLSFDKSEHLSAEDMKLCLRGLHQGNAAGVLAMISKTYRFGKEEDNEYDFMSNSHLAKIKYKREKDTFIFEVYFPVHYLVHNSMHYHVPKGEKKPVEVPDHEWLSERTKYPNNEKIFSITSRVAIDLSRFQLTTKGAIIPGAEAKVIVEGFSPNFRYIGPSWESARKHGIDINLESGSHYVVAISIDQWIDEVLQDDKQLKDLIKKTLMGSLAKIKELIKQIIQVGNTEPMQQEKLLSTILSLYVEAETVGELKKIVKQFAANVAQNVNNMRQKKRELFDSLSNVREIFLNRLKNKESFLSLLDLGYAELLLIFMKLNPIEIEYLHRILKGQSVRLMHESADYLQRCGGDNYVELYPTLKLTKNYSGWMILCEQIKKIFTEINNCYADALTMCSRCLIVLQSLSVASSQESLQAVIFYHATTKALEKPQELMVEYEKIDEHIDASDWLADLLFMKILDNYENIITSEMVKSSSTIGESIKYFVAVIEEVVEKSNLSILRSSVNFNISQPADLPSFFRLYFENFLKVQNKVSPLTVDMTLYSFLKPSVNIVLKEAFTGMTPPSSHSASPYPINRRLHRRSISANLNVSESIGAMISPLPSRRNSARFTPESPRMSKVTKNMLHPEFGHRVSPGQTMEGNPLDDEGSILIISDALESTTLSALNSPAHQKENDVVSNPSRRSLSVYLSDNRRRHLSASSSSSNMNSTQDSQAELSISTSPDRNSFEQEYRTQHTNTSSSTLTITIPNVDNIPSYGNDPTDSVDPDIEPTLARKMIKFSLSTFKQVRSFSKGEAGAILWGNNFIFAQTIIGGCAIFYSCDQLITPYPDARQKAQFPLMGIECLVGTISALAARQSILNPGRGKSTLARLTEALSYTLMTHVYLTNLAIIIEQIIYPDKQTISDQSWFLELNGLQFVIFIPSILWRTDLKSLKRAMSPSLAQVIDNCLEFLWINAILHIDQKVCHLIPKDPKLNLILQIPLCVASAAIVVLRNKFPLYRNRTLLVVSYMAVCGYVGLFIENIVSPHSIYPTAKSGVETFNAEVWARVAYYLLSFGYSLYAIARYGLEFARRYNEHPSIAIVPYDADGEAHGYQPLDSPEAVELFESKIRKANTKEHASNNKREEQQQLQDDLNELLRERFLSHEHTFFHPRSLANKPDEPDAVERGCWSRLKSNCIIM
ncbi:MAG: hypothetical protein ACOVQX_07475 [Legionella sp.]